MLAFILFIPLPHTLRCNLIVMPSEIETVWVKESGLLESFEVSPGQTVTAGQTLAQLRNLELEMQLVTALGKIQEKELLSN